MVQQLFNEVERLKAEIARLRGRVDAFSAGGQIIPSNITFNPVQSNNAQSVIQNFINNSGGNLEDGDVVVLDTAGARQITTTITPQDVDVLGVVRDFRNTGPFANAAETPVLLLGNMTGVKVNGAVAVGDYLVTTNSVTRAKSVASDETQAGIFGIAETVNAAGDGTVTASIFPVSYGASSSSGVIGRDGPPGIDGPEGDEGPMGPPGPIGPSGAAGSQGPMGQMGAIVWMESDDPELAMPIPGLQGETGPIGPAGINQFSGSRVFRSTNQSISVSTSTPISFDTERYDEGDYWSAGDPTKFVAPETGYYHMGGTVYWDSNTIGLRDVLIRLNGTTFIVTNQVPASPADAQHSVGCDWFLNAGDFVQLVVFQNNGTRTITSTAARSPEFWIHRIFSSSRELINQPLGVMHDEIDNEPFLMIPPFPSPIGTAPGGELGGTWESPTVDATHSGSAHHAQVHGHTDHTDRTRRISLIPGAATIAVGTPDLAIRGANLRYAAWAFDAAADEVINFTFTIPDDYVSGGQFLLWWTNGGAGAGNVVWALRTRGIDDAGDLNTSTGETAVDDTIAAPALNTVKASLHSSTPTYTANQMIRVNIGRLGTAGGDTLANDAWLLHMDFRYTADM